MMVNSLQLQPDIPDMSVSLVQDVIFNTSKYRPSSKPLNRRQSIDYSPDHLGIGKGQGTEELLRY